MLWTTGVVFGLSEKFKICTIIKVLVGYLKMKPMSILASQFQGDDKRISVIAQYRDLEIKNLTLYLWQPIQLFDQ